jgi:Tol biopolymer transport system component
MFQRDRHLSVWIAIVCFLIVVLIPGDASGQYFGQNKVRYETYEFKVLKTQHFDIHYYDEAADAVQEVARMAERWYARLSSALAHDLPPNQPIILYANHPAFRGTTVIPDYIGETTGGVTEGLRRRLIMPLAGPLKDTDHVLGHELVHAFQFDILQTAGLPGSAYLPLWFVEGMAEYLSVGPVDPLTAMWMRDAVRREELPLINKLDNPRYFPYRYGQALWAYIGGKYGDEVVGRILRTAARGGNVERAISAILKVQIDALSKEWHSDLNQRYGPVLRASTPPQATGEPVVSARRMRGEMNIGPVLSPDGRRMVFFSERDLFSVDLYLADAETGEVLDKITETAVDPHMDSLQFVNSAGGWSADGKRFAFGGIANGRPELSIYNVDEKHIEKSVRFPQLGEILNLTWSPDGRSIALSAMRNGVTDLLVLDVQSEMMRDLTNDMFADLQPAWSPDGASIAFVTDRFSSTIEDLSFGDYRLGLIDLNGRIQPVRGFDSGKHINPQWSADSSNIYFVSDRDGIANIYRMSRSGGAMSQVTNLQTGVSGISYLSPAFSLATGADRIAFSIFSEGNYSIHRLDGQAALAGTAPTNAIAELSAANLAVGSNTASEVAARLRNARSGLPPEGRVPPTKYDPNLDLDYIANPEVSVGVGNFGSMVGGGTAFSFSDILGHHTLTTTVQTTMFSEGGNFLNNLGGVATYANQKSRWTWGFTGGQVPFTTGDFSRAFTTINGMPLVLDQTIQYWQIHREMSAFVAYPFNRARRLEFSGGFRNISFDAQRVTEFFDLNTGQFLADNREDIPSPEAIRSGIASAALVYDTAISAGTSPILGQRYRFEVAGSGGGLNYMGLLGDYRRYFQLARPLTVAGRLLHYGRYGGDAEDTRLQDLFIGYDSLVRGYGASSFSPTECGAELEVTGACPVFDQLFGSRMVVANAEVRVPLLGALGVIPSSAVPPVETALFYDAGVAWTRNNSANFLGGDRRPVTSYGASLRVNLLGFAVAQISYVHPNDRPARRWMWEFGLVSGF